MEWHNKYNSGIYQIINKINNKVYVGQSCNIKNRKGCHFATLKGNYHYNKHLQSAFNKYGVYNFEFSILEICPVENSQKKNNIG